MEKRNNQKKKHCFFDKKTPSNNKTKKKKRRSFVLVVLLLVFFFCVLLVHTTHTNNKHTPSVFLSLLDPILIKMSMAIARWAALFKNLIILVSWVAYYYYDLCTYSLNDRSNVMTAVLVAPFLFILSAISLNCVQRLTEWIASLAKVWHFWRWWIYLLFHNISLCPISLSYLSISCIILY